MKMISGTANPRIAQQIASHLDEKLIDPQIKRFANGEIFCKISENVRNEDVFVVQSVCPPDVNGSLMELLIMVDALKRASAKSITAVLPHLAYLRQDRKAVPRSPISAKLIANMITAAGVDRVLTMDVHSTQTVGFFDIPIDNIYATPIFLDHMTHFKQPNTVMVSPDAGGVTRARYYAKHLDCGFAMIDKRRTDNQAIAMNVVGDVKDKNVIIVDDMIDTGGTLLEACRCLKEHGAKEIKTYATHPVFSDPMAERIGSFDHMVVTDTIPLSEKLNICHNVTVLDTAHLFATAISRMISGKAVSELFE